LSGESRDYPFRSGDAVFMPRGLVAGAPSLRAFELFLEIVTFVLVSVDEYVRKYGKSSVCCSLDGE
jgi:hypothetical protein